MPLPAALFARFACSVPRKLVGESQERTSPNVGPFSVPAIPGTSLAVIAVGPDDNPSPLRHLLAFHAKGEGTNGNGTMVEAQFTRLQALQLTGHLPTTALAMVSTPLVAPRLYAQSATGASYLQIETRGTGEQFWWQWPVNVPFTP